MLVYLTDVRDERVVLILVNWIGLPAHPNIGVTCGYVQSVGLVPPASNRQRTDVSERVLETVSGLSGRRLRMPRSYREDGRAARSATTMRPRQ
jgi:hypothetical protein